METLIDTKNHKLILPDRTIDLEIRTLEPPSITLNANNSQIIKLPVSQTKGNIFLPKDIQIKDAIIPSGVYKAKQGYAKVLARNYGDTLTFHWTKPAKTYELDKMIEINHMSTHPYNDHPQNYIANLENLIRTDHLNKEEKHKLFEILKQNLGIIHQEKEKLSCTTAIRHRIKTKDDIPIHTKTYRYPNIHKAEVNRQIEEMIADGIIQHSISPWTSPIWIVPKKSDASGKEKWRIVVDYRKLNEKTIDDRYPIPNIEEILDKLGRSMYFTTLDLKSGFHQIEVDKKDRPKTAFSTEKGHFEFIRMPFGLKNAPATFQRAMNNILGDLVGRNCLVYLDDIIIFGKSLQQHLDNLNKVLKKLIESNLKVQLDKCEFLRKECEFLGHIVTQDGIKPNPNKIEKILHWPIPKTTTHIKGFLGILGYYRKFIKDFSKLTKPLTKCLKKGSKITHNDEFINCFNDCKQMLTTDPILKYPDFSRKFILETDASDFALGAVLSQKFEDGKEHPIAYASRTLNETECNYSATEKELLAIVWATKHFRPYIFGTVFEIRTDHKPLVWLRQKNDLNRRLLHWKLALEEFEFEIKYKKGTLNGNADALSRITENPALTSELNANTASNNTDTMTQHSADTNDDEFIPATEKPLNEFRNQIILEENNNDSREAITLFGNYHRITIKTPLFGPAMLINIIKEYASPKCVTGICCSEKILQNLQIIYKNYFSRAKSIKLFWTKTILEDVTDEIDQDLIIERQHNANHRGIIETKLHIARKYYFPNMKTKITKFINICKICQKAKYERRPYKQKYQITATPKKPLEIVHMDIFIISDKHFLTLCDKFSRLTMAIPLQSRNAIHILKALTQFFANVGRPCLLVMDQECSFKSTTIKQFLEENNIESHYTSVGQSSSNGTIEIVHRTIRELHNIISLRDSTKNLSTTSKINLAVSIYNDSIHSQTNISPKELFFGFKNEDPIPEDLQERIKQKEELYRVYATKQKEKKSKYIEKLNKTREEPELFKDNDTIFERKRNNLKHEERYRETKVFDNLVTNILDRNGRKIHKSKLKRKRKT